MKVMQTRFYYLMSCSILIAAIAD